MAKATLISIGDEILIGQIVNTNSVFMAQKLYEVGIKTHEMHTISDTPEAIANALDKAALETDIIILTGGLGPTNDDVTKHTLCQYFGDTLKLYPDILEHVKVLLERHTTTPLNEKNKEQALLPSKAKILKNHFGTASGMWFEKEDKVYVSLPGVPYEMEHLLQDAVLPKLQKKFSLPFLYHKTILTQGLGESVIAQRIEAWEKSLPPHITLAYLPNLSRLRLRISSQGTAERLVKKEVEQQIEKLLPLISDVFIGFEDGGPLEQQIADRLTEMGATLALAESCSGGQLASTFTALPGASSYFLGSAVTYATNAKSSILSVPEPLLSTHGAVSAATAKAMAKGVQQQFGSDYALSITGNAGPTVGDPHADLGTVFIGLARPKGEVQAKKLQLGRHRKRVITRALQHALTLLYQEIKST